MSQSWIRLPGTLVQGHQVASQPSRSYPYGSVEKQKPFFKKLGVDLSPYFDGTLNISIAPLDVKMKKPEFVFRHVEWTDLHPPEDFSFSRCRITFRERLYEGWVYYPHPETKNTHFRYPSVVEVVTFKVPGIQYGDAVELELNQDEITVCKPDEPP